MNLEINIILFFLRFVLTRIFPVCFTASSDIESNIQLAFADPEPESNVTDSVEGTTKPYSAHTGDVRPPSSSWARFNASVVQRPTQEYAATRIQGRNPDNSCHS